MLSLRTGMPDSCCLDMMCIHDAERKHSCTETHQNKGATRHSTSALFKNQSSRHSEVTLPAMAQLCCSPDAWLAGFGACSRTSKCCHRRWLTMAMCAKQCWHALLANMAMLANSVAMAMLARSDALAMLAQQQCKLDRLPRASLCCLGTSSSAEELCCAVPMLSGKRMLQQVISLCMLSCRQPQALHTTNIKLECRSVAALVI